MSKKLKKNQRYIYVLLSRTHTVLATLIRLYTREPYSHVSVSLDAEMNHLYSFGRKWRLIPFIGGFIKEDLEKGVYGADAYVKCRVYKVPVTEEQYRYISDEIQHFVENKDTYGYNYIGLFGAPFGIRYTDDTHFMCSQFVTHIFNSGGIRLFSKDMAEVRPFDFHSTLKDEQIYEGKLCNYRTFLASKERHHKAENEDVYAEAI